MSFRPTLESLEERTLLNHGKGIHPSLLTGEIEGEGQALQVHASLRMERHWSSGVLARCIERDNLTD